MFVNALQLACNKLLLLVHGGLAIYRPMSYDLGPIGISMAASL